MFLEDLLSASIDLDPKLKLVIDVNDPGRMRGQSGVDIAGVQVGIDFDHGKLIFIASRPLSPLDDETRSAILQSVRQGQSWHGYQQYKKMNDKLKAAQARINELESALAAANRQD